MLRIPRLPLANALNPGFAFLGGCNSGNDPHTSVSGLPKAIVIGPATAKSNYLLPYDAYIAAVEKLVKETNARGGIDGSKIRVVSVGNRCEPQQQPVAVQEVLEDDADVLIFSREVRIAAAGAPIADENNEINAIRETGTTHSAELATAPEAGSHSTMTGSLSCMRDDHLPSGPWYIYECPNREPKLLEQFKPAYVPEYEQQ